MPVRQDNDSPVASTEEIRSHFPALERQEGARPVAYFDGPGGTQVPRVVVDAMADYLLNHNANTHWSFPTSMETDNALAEARQTFADFFNATPGEIVFGPNMTTLTFHLARSLGRAFGPGDEIVVTELDHHANVDPWKALEREREVTVRVARMIPESGQLDWEHLESLIGDRTKIVAIGAASNAIGTVNDIPRAARLAHDAGAELFVDAVHYAPHELVDVQGFNCDFLACSAYKFYGPHVGILFGRKERLESLDVPKLAPAPNTAPERLETGTQNHEGIVGAARAVNFLASLAHGPTRRARLESAYQVLHARGSELVSALWSGLSTIDGVRIFGPLPGSPRTPTVSFTVAGHTSADVCKHLAGQGLFASHGDFYAQTVIARLGEARDGLVRIGCACYTTNEEINRLIDEVRTIAGR